MEASGRKRLILLVEDNDDHAELVARCFERRRDGIVLERLSDGEAALAWLDARRAPSPSAPDGLPDLILLDLRLPKIDGMEVLDRLKADESLRAVPVVVLSSSDAEADVVRAYGRHANSYVVKPLDFERLNAVLEGLGIFWLDINRGMGPRRP